MKIVLTEALMSEDAALLVDSKNCCACANLRGWDDIIQVN